MALQYISDGQSVHHSILLAHVLVPSFEGEMTGRTVVGLDVCVLCDQSCNMYESDDEAYAIKRVDQDAQPLTMPGRNMCTRP